jgi:hypothetical protein
MAFGLNQKGTVYVLRPSPDTRGRWLAVDFEALFEDLGCLSNLRKYPHADAFAEHVGMRLDALYAFHRTKNRLPVLAAANSPDELGTAILLAYRERKRAIDFDALLLSQRAMHLDKWLADSQLLFTQARGGGVIVPPIPADGFDTLPRVASQSTELTIKVPIPRDLLKETTKR